MARFNLKDLNNKKDVVRAKRDKAKKQSAKVMPTSKQSKKKRGCGCGGRRKKQ